MIIVETSVWVDFFRGVRTRQTTWLLENLGQPVLGLTDLTYCEILQGQRTDASFEQLRYSLQQVGVHPTGGVELAEAAARNYRALRRKGVTIRTTIDCLIATFCLREGHTLLHSDRDFTPFEQHLGLKVMRG